jgi:hypothetical protein
MYTYTFRSLRLNENKEALFSLDGVHGYYQMHFYILLGRTLDVYKFYMTILHGFLSVLTLVNNEYLGRNNTLDYSIINIHVYHMLKRSTRRFIMFMVGDIKGTLPWRDWE